MPGFEKLILHCLVICALGLQAGCIHYQPKPLSLAETSESFESRSLTNAAVREFVREHLPGQTWTNEQWELEPLVLAAVFYNPSLQLARLQGNVAEAGQVTAAARPNPAVGFSPGYNFDAVNPITPWIPGMTVDYLVETAGKRGKRMQQARFIAEASRWEVAAAAWQVRSHVQAALIDFSAARSREALMGQQLTNETSLRTLLDQRLEAGAATRFEVAPFELAVVRLQSDLAAARAASVQARAQLAEAVGIPAKALDLQSIDFDIPDMIALPPDRGELRTGALRRRADLLALLARYEAAQAALQLEIARQYPDLRLGSGYQWDQGESKWNLSLNLEVPIFNRNQGPIAEAGARREAAAAQVIERQAQILHEIDRAEAALLAAREEAERAGQVHEALEEQSRFTRARLAAGGADQVEARTALLEEQAASLIALEARARAARAVAAWEAAVQAPSFQPETLTPRLSSSP